MSERPKALASWIGHSDLVAMARDVGGEVADKVAQLVGAFKRPDRGHGPLRSLVDAVNLARIDLISNYPQDINRAYQRWLGKSATIHPVRLSDPTDYAAVFAIADERFREAWEAARANQWQFCIHLSPGTPTMAAVSVLLGKTRYPATLYQTYESRVRETQIPFDMDLWFSDRRHEAGQAFQELAFRGSARNPAFTDIVGNSPEILRAIDRSQRAAAADVNVLVTGESGTGKELFARAIHAASPRGHRQSDKFVALNCAALPATLLEAELFGVAKGAATDVKERAGAFERAHDGTLFLDEVGECSLDNQAKLLRALQPQPGEHPCCRAIQRVGDDRLRKFNVRIVTATNRNLLVRSAEQAFRADLYYRLATITINLPPLRQRKSEDILQIAESLLNQIHEHLSRSIAGHEPRVLSRAAARRLAQHTWPGNVRELNNVLVEAVLMSQGSELSRHDIDQSIHAILAGESTGPLTRTRQEGFSLAVRMAEIERTFIEDALAEANGNQTKAAVLLGISQQNLSQKLTRRGFRLE